MQSRFGSVSATCKKKPPVAASNGPRRLLFAFIKSNLLRPLLDVKVEIPHLVKVLRPLCYKSLLSVLNLSRNSNHCLPEELDYAVLEQLLTRVASPGQDEVLDQRLQVFRLWAPDARSLALSSLI